MVRGLPLRCATLNLSWQANSLNVGLDRGDQFRNVPFDQGGMVKRIPGYPFSAAYHLSAETLIKGSPDVVLLQEVSVPISMIPDVSKVSEAVESMLFSASTLLLHQS